MPIDLQTAELTSRVRRGFGQRGALSIALDETAVPVIPIYDLDSPPFRTDGVRFYCSARIPAGGAGTFAGLQLINPTNANVIAVVDQIIFGNDDAAAHSYSVAFDLGTGSIAFADIVPEKLTSSPLAPGTFTVAAPGGTVMIRATLPTFGQLVIPVEIAVEPGHNVAALCADANIAAVASMSGRYWTKQA